MIKKGDWLLLNADIKFEHTSKQFYGKYCFKLVVFAPGGRSIYNNKRTIEQSIHIRQQVAKNYNPGGSWGVSRWSQEGFGRYVNLADVNLLAFFKQKKSQLKDTIKFRVDEPFITLYASTEQELLDFARELPGENSDKIELISAPTSDQAKALLESGAIITNNPREYAFKVTLRDGRYTTETKTTLLNYLLSLGTDVELPKASKTHLSRLNWMYNVYFYCNDDRIVTMLNLMAPNIVRAVNSLVHKNPS